MSIVVHDPLPGLRARDETAAPRRPEPWILDPAEALRAVRLRWPLVLLPVLLCLAGVLAWRSATPPRYTASAQLLVDPRALQVLKDGVGPQEGGNEASLVLVDSQIRVLASDEVLKQVVTRFGLARDAEWTGADSPLAALRDAVARALGRAGPAPEPELEALRRLRDATAARRLERSFVVELAVTSRDPDRAAALAQGIADTYLATEAEARSAASRRAGEALTARLGELQAALRDAETRAQAFRASRNMAGTRAQLVSEQQLTQLSDQLGASRARVAERRAQLAQLDALIGRGGDIGAIPEVVQSATVGQLRGQIAQLDAQRADLADTLGARHPALRTVEVQVASLRRALDTEIRRVAAAARTDFRAAAANEAALAATLDARKREALAAGDDFVRLRELEREVEASRSVYETFLLRARELGEQGRFDTSNSRVISPALPPERRTGPPLLALLAAASAAGLGLGAAGALGAEWAGGRVRSRRRLELATGARVLGALPPRPPGARTDPAYEAAVARLGIRLAREVSGGRPSSLLVTSADDGRGRQALARGLARAAADEGSRVLLVHGGGDEPAGSEAGPDTAYTSLARRREDGPASPAYDPLAGAAAFDLVIVDAGDLGRDILPERLGWDDRLTAILVTASARRSRLRAVRDALALLGDAGRVRLVLTDARGDV